MTIRVLLGMLKPVEIRLKTRWTHSGPSGPSRPMKIQGLPALAPQLAPLAVHFSEPQRIFESHNTRKENCCQVPLSLADVDLAKRRHSCAERLPWFGSGNPGSAEGMRRGMDGMLMCWKYGLFMKNGHRIGRQFSGLSQKPCRNSPVLGPIRFPP